MKAAVIKKWGNARVFEMAELPKPLPAENQLLIKVFASSINPVDWKHRLGNHRFILGSPFPIVLGYDVCGEVLESGETVTKFNPGDIVFGDLDNKYGGALAEFALGHEKCFALKPASISNNEAAALSLAGLTALQALRDKANLRPGQKVLINGASGGVGHLAIQIAHNLGAQVIAVSGTKSRELVLGFNPYRFIDYSKEDILKISEKVDVFFDVSATSSYLKCRHLLMSGGTYINTHPRPVILFHKFLALFSKNKKVTTLLRKHSSSDMDLIAQWLTEGKLKVIIDRVFPIEEIGNAHEYAEAGHTKGKNVIVIGSTVN
jgi:NADPH:quinone reductase-like Zn-dependent oxidoreductase